MAVIRVKETWDSRSGSEDDMGEREYVRTFRVVTDDPLTSSLSVRYATGIPARFDPYQDADGNIDAGSFVKEIRESQDQDNPFTWLVSVTYSSKLEQPEYGDEDPLARPAEISRGTIKFLVPATTDRDGNAIVNSANQAFDPPIEREEYRRTLRVVKNLITYDDTWEEYLDAVNDKAWFGFEAGEAKLVNLTAVRKYEKGLEYQEVTFEIEGAPPFTRFDALLIGDPRPVSTERTWTKHVLDQGYRDIDDKVFRDKESGQPKATPTLLDGEGAALVLGVDRPVFLDFDLNPDMNFDLLPIP